MKGDGHGLESGVLSHLLDLDEGHEFFDVRLDRRQAHQSVEFLHGVLFGLLGRLRGICRVRRRSACRSLYLGRCAGGSVSACGGIDPAGIARDLCQVLRSLAVGLQYALRDLVCAGHQVLGLLQRLLGVAERIRVLFIGPVQKLCRRGFAVGASPAFGRQLRAQLLCLLFMI